MKPRLLEMTAFGPFASKEKLDFSCLSNMGLFLIHGSTGAGKSTILDAMTFALFGESAAGLRKVKEMRCTYSASHLQTEVCLTFSLGNESFRICRVPEQKLEKVVRAQAVVYSEDQVIVSGSSVVTAWVEQKLGLTSLQFRQLIVLPQGEFQRFLLSGSSDKSEVLETLFGTELYTRVEQLLEEKSASARSKLQRIEDIKSALMQSLKIDSFENLHIEETELKSRIAVDEKLCTTVITALDSAKRAALVSSRFADLELRCHELRNRNQTLNARKPEMEKLCQQIARALAAATVAAEDDLLSRLEQNCAELSQKIIEESALLMQAQQALELNEDEQCRSEETFRLAELKASEVPLLEKEFAQVEKLESEFLKYLASLKNVTEASVKIDDLQREIARIEQKIVLVKSEVEQAEGLQAEIAQIQTDLTAIINCASLCHQLKTKLHVQEQLFLKRTGLESELRRIENQRKAVENKFKAGERAYYLEAFRDEHAISGNCPVCESQGQPNAMLGPHRTHDLKHAQDLLRGAGSSRWQSEKLIEELSQAISRLIPEIAGIQGEEKQLSAHCSSLREELTAHLFKNEMEWPSELNIALNDSVKNSVNVSLSAGLTPEVVSCLEQLNEYFQKQNELKTDRKASLEKQWAHSIKLKESLKKGAAQLDKERLCQVELNSKLFSFKLTLKEFELNFVNGWKCLFPGRAFEQDELKLQDLLLEKKMRLSETLQKIATELLAAKTACTQVRTRSAELKLRVSKHQNQQTAWGGQLEQLKMQVFAQRQKLENVLQAAGFEGSNYRDELREHSEIDSAKKKHEDFVNESLQVHALLEEAESQMQKIGTEVMQSCAQSDQDFEALYAPHALHQVERDHEVSRVTLLEEMRDTHLKNTERRKQRLEQLSDALQKMAELDHEQKGIGEQFETLGTLAALVKGQNGSKLSLKRFVLGAVLETVIAVASARLNLMSKGRFVLVRAMQFVDRRKTSGLDLAVIDSFSGSERAVSTLSGGETFMTSLALALALSEVVESFAGGKRLESVFFDEGFGSLDPDSLDLAMSCLENVNKSGRVIGIISHVAELKERISNQAEIIATRSGSRIRIRNLISPS